MAPAEQAAGNGWKTADICARLLATKPHPTAQRRHELLPKAARQSPRRPKQPLRRAMPVGAGLQYLVLVCPGEPGSQRGVVASSTPAWWPHRCTGLAHCDRGLRDDTTNCCTTADLAACLQREVAARESRGGEGRIRVARFPARRSLQDFDSCRVADIIMNGDPDLLPRGRAGRGRRRSPRCRCRATRSRGRGPATRHAGSAGAAGPARRRLPGRRLLRQSPRRDHPRPADRRRRPHRPPRPRPHHRVPARRLASPDRMDEPVPGRLRAACHRGLTSPDPVTAPARGPGRQPRTLSRIPGQAAEQASGRKAAPGKSARSFIRQPEQQDRHQNFGGGLRLRGSTRFMGVQLGKVIWAGLLGCGCGCGCGRVADVHARLQQPEVRAPLTDRDDLPVHDDWGAHAPGQYSQLRVTARHVPAGAGAAGSARR
jgi:hypothetical protein